MQTTRGLKRPIFCQFVMYGVAREEVIEYVLLDSMDDDTIDDEERQARDALIERGNYDRKPLHEDFDGFSVKAAIRRAYADAHGRAFRYCTQKAIHDGNYYAEAV